ncbi:MAG: YCF48-related protein [Planctomycetota bacterium]|jgi:photosystem II stability/assembly factor-like uncharacterized protein
MTREKSDITKRRGAVLLGRLALGAAAIFVAPTARAQVFNWFDPIIDISDSGTGSWTPIDVSANVPAGATGVMLQVKTEGSSDDEFAIRKNGSSDEWMWGPTTIKNDTHTWFMIGVDSNRIFEVKQGDNDIDMYLLGYTTAGVTFFDNAYNKTTSGAGWEDVDISTETGGDTAIAAVFIIHNTGNSQNWSIRQNGAADNRGSACGGSAGGDLRTNMATLAIVGLDANEICEICVESTEVKAYLVGYVTSGAVFFQEPIQKTVATSYVDNDITPHIGSDDANGAFVQIWTDFDDRHQTAIRKNGASHDYDKWTSNEMAPVAIDASNIFEFETDDTDGIEIWLYGYSLTTGGGAGPSGTGWTVGNAGTILKTTDGGANWSSQTSGTTENLRVSSFPTDDQTGYTAGWNSTILKTTDGGTNWSVQNTGGGIMLQGMHFPVDADTGYAVGDQGTILNTTNGGTNWSAQTSGTTEELRGIIFPVDATTGYAVGSNGTILKTTNGGTNWASQTSATGENLRCVCFPVDATTGYAVGNNGAIEKTVDGGANWSSQSSGTTEKLFSVDFPVDATTGWAVGDGPTILKTTDGGSNWTPQTAGTTEDLRAVDFADDDQTGWAVGTTGEIIVTTDGGSNWNTQTSGTAQELRGVHFPVPYVDPTNYRSIGTDTGTLVSGNASIAQDSTTMTFGTSLPSNVGQGDEISIGGDTFYIKTKDSSTVVTVHSAATTTHTNTAFTIQRAYNTMQSWENARDGDLVGENRREVGVCYKDGPFTATTRINDSTTDSSRYMMLTVAENQRHDGTAGTGVVIDAGGGFGQSVIDIQDQYTRIEWLEITNWHDGDRGLYFDEAPAADNSDWSIASNIIAHDFNCGNNDASFLIRSENVIIRNCVIYDGQKYGIFLKEVGSATIENCTVYGMTDSGASGDGIHQTAGSNLTVRNTISVGNKDEDFDLEGTVDYFDYNMYTNYGGFTPSGSNDQSPPASLDDLFVSVGSGTEDLHLESGGHNALDTGVDIAGYSGDIDGELRASGSWDLGADEMSGDINYRSIGTQAGTLYSTGDATVSAGSRTVTFGGGASLPTNVGQGDALVIGAETLYILSRDSSLEVTTQTAAAGAHSGAAYTISRAYNDFQSWETARQGDLAGEARREVGVAYNDGVFNAGLTFDGSVTSATQYMMLTVAAGQRHGGVRNTGARIDTQSGTDDVIVIEDDYVRVEWLALTNFDGADTNDGILGVNNRSDNAYISHVFMYDYSPGTGVHLYDDGTIRNSIFYEGEEGLNIEGGVVTIENVTIYNMDRDGVDVTVQGQVTVRNTISVSNGWDDFEITGSIDYFGYNMYSSVNDFDPASYQGNNQSPPADLDDLFYTIASGSEDLHLEDSGHNARDTGINLSATFTGDIDGEARAVPWDMGADEVTSPLRIASGANQTFTEGDSTTAISPITVTDQSATPAVTAVNDIRIRIPAGFNMDWDIFDTLATISGSAAGKVSSTVTYEDSDKTLVIDVTSDFAASDAITISDLSYTNFSAASSTDYLDLDINDDATADATDSRTIEILALPPEVLTGTPLVSWREVEPGNVPAPGSSVAVTFDDVTPNISSDARNSVSFAHTIGSCSCCSDAIIVVVTVTRGDQECTAVSYGGQALAPAISERASTDSGNEWVKIWYRTDPLPGTNMVDVTYGIAESPDAVVALSYFGVDQASPIGAVAGNSSTSSSNPVTVNIATTVDGSVVVGGLGQHGGDTDPHAQGADITTEHWDTVSGGATSSDSGYAGGEIATTTTGIFTFEWTGNVNDDWAIACVELKPAQ